jgi:hypothetical protein
MELDRKNNRTLGIPTLSNTPMIVTLKRRNDYVEKGATWALI